MKDKIINGTLYWLSTWLSIVVIALTVYTAGGTPQTSTRLYSLGLLGVGIWAYWKPILSWHWDIVEYWTLQGKPKLGKSLAWLLWSFLLPGVWFVGWFLVPLLTTAAIILISPLLQMSLFNGPSLALLIAMYVASWAWASSRVREEYFVSMKIWKWSIHHFWIFNVLGVLYFILRMKVPFFQS